MKTSQVKCPTHVFLAGGGWTCAFYIGAYRAMRERWTENELSKIIWSGNSAGALIALGICLNKSPDEMENIYTIMLRNAEKYGTFGKVSIYQDCTIDMCLNDDINAYKRCNNRLFIGITKFPCQHTLISHWNSNDELRNTLHQSMHIPYWMTHTKYNSDGIIGIDGGFSKTHYRFNKNTLVLSPFATDTNEAEVLCIPAAKFKDSFFADFNVYNKLKNEGYTRMHEWNGEYCKYVSEMSLQGSIGTNTVSDVCVTKYNYNKWKRNFVMYPVTFFAWFLRFMEQVLVLKKVVPCVLLCLCCYYYYFRFKLKRNRKVLM